jgi:hypothetical protein
MKSPMLKISCALLMLVIAAGCAKEVRILPRVKITNPVSPLSGNAVIAFVLQDRDARDADIVCEYSLDLGTTYLPAAAGPGCENTANLASSLSGIAHAFVWNTSADLGNASIGPICFRITPYINTTAGHLDVSTAFYVRNYEFSGASGGASLDNAADAASPVAFAADNADVLYAAWADGRGAARRIYLAKSLDGGVSFAPGTIAAAPSDNLANQDSPVLCAGNASEIYLAWVESTANSSKIRFARTIDSAASFSPAVDVKTPASGETQSEPHMVFDLGEKQIYISYTSAISNSSNLFTVRSDNGGASFQRFTISGEDGNQSAAMLAHGRGDFLYAVWTDDRSGNSAVYSGMSYYDAVSFKNINTVAPLLGGSKQTHPVVCAGAEGYVFAAWLGETTLNNCVYLSRSDVSAKTFETPQMISAAIVNATGLSMAADRAGKIYLVCSEISVPGSTVRLVALDETDFPPNIGTMTIYDIATSTVANSRPAVYVNKNGVPVIFWLDDVSGNLEPFSAVGQ